ncbi:FAD-binding oxidoreductase [Cribrihabitans neustonicus]|uniref:FAD-binding oxidoreductase n=1 Tax=Cribrihabitans neustonicus TaxID=1429085 RepID=UPI003B5A3D27
MTRSPKPSALANRSGAPEPAAPASARSAAPPPLNPAGPEFAARFSGRLPEGVLRQPEPRFLEEPRGRYRGQAGLVALPQTVEQAALILREANAALVPVVPYGGGTGLVGGQVMPDGPAPLVLGLERMAAIRAVHAQENVLIAEAGAILADVQAAAEAADRLFPLSLAAEGSARIGGNLATNAGGVGVLRYGNARDLCLGLEAVLPTGDIWHGLTRLRKDNTGYDLRNLLIGSEGTLGVITAAALKLAPVPAAQGTALLAVRDPAAALELLARARDQLGEAVSAFELMHRQGLEFLAETLPQVRQPFAVAPEWCVLVELGLPRGLDPEAALAALFEAGEAAGLVSDGVIAQSGAQRQELWTVREHIPLANKAIGSVSSHDISLPLSEIPAFIESGPKAVAEVGDFRINCFGHLGDGNLHYNVFPPKGQRRAACDHLRGAVKQAVHDLVRDFGGSFSAEHGVGRLKTGDLERYGDPARLAAMRAIKRALDPNGIMNPGVILPRG